MTALALILSAFVAAIGLLAIFFPGRADDIARLFADKTGLWVATAITSTSSRGPRSAREMLFEDACLLPSAPPYRQRSRKRARQSQSAQHSGQLIPPPRSTLTLLFATSSSPKPKRFPLARSSQAQV